MFYNENSFNICVFNKSVYILIDINESMFTNIYNISTNDKNEADN